MSYLSGRALTEEEDKKSDLRGYLKWMIFTLHLLCSRTKSRFDLELCANSRLRWDSKVKNALETDKIIKEIQSYSHERIEKLLEYFLEMQADELSSLDDNDLCVYTTVRELELFQAIRELELAKIDHARQLVEITREALSLHKEFKEAADSTALLISFTADDFHEYVLRLHEEFKISYERTKKIL